MYDNSVKCCRQRIEGNILGLLLINRMLSNLDCEQGNT